MWSFLQLLDSIGQSVHSPFYDGRDPWRSLEVRLARPRPVPPHRPEAEDARPRGGLLRREHRVEYEDARLDQRRGNAPRAVPGPLPLPELWKPEGHRRLRRAQPTEHAGGGVAASPISAASFRDIRPRKRPVAGVGT